MLLHRDTAASSSVVHWPTLDAAQDTGYLASVCVVFDRGLCVFIYTLILQFQAEIYHIARRLQLDEDHLQCNVHHWGISGHKLEEQVH